MDKQQLIIHSVTCDLSMLGIFNRFATWLSSGNLVEAQETPNTMRVAVIFFNYLVSFSYVCKNDGLNISWELP